MSDDGAVGKPAEEPGQPAEGSFGWYAYAPLGQDTGRVPATVEVTWIGLSDDLHEGPFVSDDGAYDEDVDALAEIGVIIDSVLHADVLAWHAQAIRRQGESDYVSASPLFVEKQSLLRRLATCAPDGIRVEAARTQPRRRFHPAALAVAEDGSVRAGHVPRLTGPHDWTGVLPDLPDDLDRDLRGWLADLPGSAWARPRRRFESERAWDAAVFAWQDRTDALGRRLQQALGDDWDITTVP